MELASNLWSALEAEVFDTASGGSVLDDLQLLDWPDNDIISTNDSLTAVGCLPGADWPVPSWESNSASHNSPCASADQASCHSPLSSRNASATTDEMLLYSTQNLLTPRGSVLSSETFYKSSIMTPQSCLMMDSPNLLEGWATSIEVIPESAFAKAPSLQPMIDFRMPLTGSQLDMRSTSSPAELPAYHKWMSTMPEALDASTLTNLPIGPRALPGSWSSGCPPSSFQAGGELLLPEHVASTGSEVSCMLTLRQPLAAPQPLHAMASQAFPLLSHANLGVLPLARDPPASLEIMPLSTPRLTADALDDFQAALMEPEDLLKLPSLPNFARSLLPDQAAAALKQKPVVVLGDTLPMTVDEIAPVMPAVVAFLGSVALKLEGTALAAEDMDCTQPNQVEDMFEMPKEPGRAAPVSRAQRGAAKRTAGRYAMSDDDSEWESEQATPRAAHARRRASAAHDQDAEPVAEAVLRNRITQRHYLQRKKGKVAAMHAHVPELEARLAELQAELAPLVQQHQTLTQELPWARQLEEVQFMAYLGDVQTGLPHASSKRATCLQKYLKDPLGACKGLFEQLKTRQLKDYAAEEIVLPKPDAWAVKEKYAVVAEAAEELPVLMPEILAKLRLTKWQKDELAVQGKENAMVLQMQREGCTAIADTLQSMLTASTESSHLGWRAALLMHALCGQLAGMQRRGADVAGRSASACAEVLTVSQAGKLTHMTEAAPSAAVALCAEIDLVKSGQKALGASNGKPGAAVPASMLMASDITYPEGTAARTKGSQASRKRSRGSEPACQLSAPDARPPNQAPLTPLSRAGKHVCLSAL